MSGLRNSRFRLAVVAAALSFGFATGAEDAVANGDTRTINLFHAHTKETISATYLVGGRYDAEVLKQLNWFLRDWRRDEPTTMDPRLFDVVWETYRSAGGGSNPVTVMSAYRSPETNAMLRHRSRAVAKHSQHMQGKAMDTSMPGMSMQQIREVGMKMQRGGVGYYPTAGTPFVHLDVGSVRSWPRMGYDQLVRLFPDGKTVHLPANGQPLARYEEARAELEAGGNVYLPPSSKSKSFFAFLFGGGGEDDDDGGGAVAPARPQRGRSRLASLPPRGQQQQVAYAPQSDALSGDDGSRSFFTAEANRREAPQVARAARDLPRGETYMAPTEPPAAKPERTAEKPPAAVAPPAPPAQPAAQPAAQPERQQVAALDPTLLKTAKPQPVEETADDKDAPEIAAAPLPPRRPSDLTFAAFAPLPPARPAELALAYAAQQPALRRDPIGAVLAEPRKSASAAPIAAPVPPARPGVAPARLDRSNFRAMSGSQPVARMTTQTSMGPSIVALRSAARAGSTVLINAPAPGAGRFDTKASNLPVSSFASTAGQRASLTGANKAN